jgi:anti-sigma-K factor RskA
MDCHQFAEIAGAYALGATSEGERRTAQAHLATCADCSRMAHEFQEVTDLLPLTVPQIEPSPALRKRVLAAVEADARVFNESWQRAVQGQRRSWWQIWQMRLALALIVVLLGCVGSLAAWNIGLQQQPSSRIYTYAVAGTLRDATASGRAIYLPEDQMSMIIVHNLPGLQGTQVYQGWLIAQQKPVSIGLLRVVNGTAILGFPGDLQQYNEIAVSIEPGPLATPQAPAGPIVAQGQLQQGQAGLLSGQDRVLSQDLKHAEGQG